MRFDQVPERGEVLSRTPSFHEGTRSRHQYFGPATALIDADASLGHPLSVYAMNLAVGKCRESGVAAVSVFNSHHFGAAGCYSRIAAERGAPRARTGIF